MYERLGEVLETLCSKGNRDAILVAPFIKRAVLTRLMNALPDRVSLLCVTRWRPDEIAAGVSDPDIWLDIQKREGAKLWLCPSLHAKYYRVDDACYIGSANLTNTALGWTNMPNLEILSPFDTNTPHGPKFEAQLLACSVRCQEMIYQQMIAAAALLKMEKAQFIITGHVAENQLADNSLSDQVYVEAFDAFPDWQSWLPKSRQPEELFHAYSEQWTLLTTESRRAALSDLSVLQIPKGLPILHFTKYVATQLLQAPIVIAVDNFLRQSQRFGAVRDYLSTLPCAKVQEFDATRSWQTLMRWLRYFLPDRYEYTKPNHSEILRVRKV